MALDVLSAAECWRLLGRHTMGRVAYTDHALPVIVPLSYTLLGHRLMLRTRGHGLAQQLDGQVVAFAVDDVDLDTAGGSSVLVTGTCRLLTRPGDMVRGDGLPGSWTGPDRDSAVCITVGRVTGSRLITLGFTEAQRPLESGPWSAARAPLGS